MPPENAPTATARAVVLGLLQAAEQGSLRGLTKTSLHKLAFRLKGEADAPEEIRHLPLYWFKHGPFFEPLNAALSDLVATGDARYDEARQIFVPVGGSTSPSAEAISAYCLGSRAMGQIPFFDSTELLRSIYKSDAPSDFYFEFRFGWWEPLASLVDEMEVATPIPPPERTAAVSLSRLRPRLLAAEGALPLEGPGFDRFNPLLSQYVSAASALTSAQGSLDDSVFLPLMRLLRNDTSSVWDVFSEAARLTWHDPYYDGRVATWLRAFDQHADPVTEHLDILYDEILARVAGIGPASRRHEFPLLQTMKEAFSD